MVPFKEKTAVPQPRTGSNELLPMQTLRSCICLYEMKAEASGSIWLVAPVSATTRLPAVPADVVGLRIEDLQRDVMAIMRLCGREMHETEENARHEVETSCV